jgi:hypothetical protein
MYLLILLLILAINGFCGLRLAKYLDKEKWATAYYYCGVVVLCQGTLVVLSLPFGPAFSILFMVLAGIAIKLLFYTHSQADKYDSW